MYWRIAVAALALLTTALSGARADGMGRPFERIAPEHWAYRAMQRLESAGYFTGAPEGTFGGARRLTRYEFAAAVERVFRSLQPRVHAAAEAGSLPQDLRGFSVLLGEFGPEIAALGHDTDEIRRQLRRMSDRLLRLQESEQSVLDTRLPDAVALDPAAGRRRAFGFAAMLDPSAAGSPERAPRPAVGPLVFPGLGAGLGAARAGLQFRPADRLDIVQGLPFQDPAAGLSYRARLSLPLGRYLLGAFYDREGGRTDRYGLDNPYFPSGPSRSLGGTLHGLLGSRLGFGVETSSMRLEDDLARMVAFRGQLDYDVGGGFGLGFGFERVFQSGALGPELDGTTYTLAVRRSLGRNAQFNFLYRYFGADEAGGSFGAGRDLSDSGALGQITVRF